MKSIIASLLHRFSLRWAVFAFITVLASIPASTQAEERLAQIFQDNMVLQRNKPVPVWGWANPGAQVEVAFAGQKKQVKADEKGYWKAVLDPLKANSQGQNLDVRIVGASTLSRKNVLVGEVWVASGQSNMVAGGPDVDTGVYPHFVSPGSKGGKPEIRVCGFGSGATTEPLDDIAPAGRGPAPWNVLQENPLSANLGPSDYFARVLRDGLDVPVGIILVAVPGTNQAAWIDRKTLEGLPALKAQGNFYQERLTDCEANLSKSAKVKSWADYEQAEKQWSQTKNGRPPSSDLSICNFPSVLYNTRIHPLAPFAIGGVIWHQGEAGPGGPYGERLVAMIKQWRGLFGQDFAFVWGTLSRTTAEPPPLAPVLSQFYRSGLNPSIHQALKSFGADKNVALAELYDLGDTGTHFLLKNEMGRRMALAALSVAYGQSQIYSGPRMAETKIAGSKAIVRFEQVGDGIAYQPSIDGISGVYLRGKSGPGRWANVKIIGKDTVEFSNPEISDLQIVAYAANSNPHETLFNSAGLPASPFTVNPPENNREPQPTVQLLSVQPNGAGLNLCHVRREGYVFQMTPAPKSAVAQVTVQAYLPAEWKAFEVEVGGKPMAATETSKDGHRFATFNVPVNGSWVIVAEKGKAAGFEKINRL